jgi:hypothetical protein
VPIAGPPGQNPLQSAASQPTAGTPRVTETRFNRSYFATFVLLRSGIPMIG